MATIGLVMRAPNATILQLARDVSHWAASKGHDILCDTAAAEMLDQDLPSVSRDDLLEAADPIITLGGDGTLIGLARYVRDKCPTMIGVNFGTLGFLTEIAPTELISVLDQVLQGDARVATRSMLNVDVVRGDSVVFTSQAVNDVVIQKGSREKLIELDVYSNDEELVRLRADGLIFATPTGSTAYSLAAGGSIAYPTLGIVLMTPICSHSLANRPFVLPQDFMIEVRLPEYSGEVFVSADGQVSFTLQSYDKLRITQAKRRVTFARSPSKSYYDILRVKLNWGIPNRPD